MRARRPRSQYEMDSRLRGKDEEGALQAIFIASLNTCELVRTLDLMSMYFYA